MIPWARSPRKKPKRKEKNRVGSLKFFLTKKKRKSSNARESSQWWRWNCHVPKLKIRESTNPCTPVWWPPKR